MNRFIWDTYLNSLEKKYSLFYINRQYEDKSFKSKQEYLDIQNKLSDEIESLNKEILASIKEVINDAYPELKILLYDSRTFSLNDRRIGSILVEGLKIESETLDVKMFFEKMTLIKITVYRFEDLPEETQKEIREVINGEV